jgi:predicted ATPase/class 3 adenylate cyclase
MGQLPSGLVTFLFTDIEGSTRLLQELGARYPHVLGDHAAILRRAIDAGGGTEVSTAGDSFFAAFPTALGAVEAARVAQLALSAHPWPGGVEVKVRMGMHTGAAEPVGGDYVGIDVNRAARISAAGHGGQVLLSEATTGAVSSALAPGDSVRDLGPHRLKDIAQPERIHQLVIAGLPDTFPPLRTLDARPNNLPAQLTSFVGREEAIAEVRALLGRTRLLTLTGTGGTGKTRLALQVAGEVLTEYRDGAFFVDLSSVTDPALVPSVVAEALGVREPGERPILDAVREHLRDRQLLLVLDNFEQVTGAAPVVEDLLSSAPRLTLMVTSRIVLSLRGEHEYAVAPLEPPDPVHVPDVLTLGRYDAVRLFTERVHAVRPHFRLTDENAPAVAEITARLDGLPLAIELAATRAKVLTPEQMLPRLQHRLSLLTSRVRTLPERQRTLRDAIAWSHDLLGEDERTLFARLSVFTGGWTLESAEAVCGPDGSETDGSGLDVVELLISLVDTSLVRRDEGPDGLPRFSMLETIREFGLEQLEARGELAEALSRHGRHYLDLAAEAEPHLTADDQAEWLDRCEREHANIRNALRWAIETGHVERAQESAAALWRFWQQRGHLAEGRRWLEEILALPAGQVPTAARARALIAAGGLAWWQVDRRASAAWYREAVDIERTLDDPSGLAEALYNDSFVVASDGDIEEATRILEESLDLFRRVGDEAGVAQAQVMLVIGDAQGGRWDQVVDRIEEVAGIWRRLGNRYHLANDLVWLAIGYARVGRKDEARRTALEALDLFRQGDSPTGISLALHCLAFLATWSGRHEEAIRLEGASESLDERAGAARTKGFAGLLEGDPVEEATPHVGEVAARRAREEGRAMTVEEAVALASEGG